MQKVGPVWTMWGLTMHAVIKQKLVSTNLMHDERLCSTALCHASVRHVRDVLSTMTASIW